MLVTVTHRQTGEKKVVLRNQLDDYDIRLWKVRAYGKVEPKPEDLGYERQPGGYLLKVR